MKKKIFGGIAIMAVAAMIVLNLSFAKINGMSNLTLYNVEALAECENTVVTSGPIITVTICNRKTTLAGRALNLCCDKEATTSCQFTNNGAC